MYTWCWTISLQWMGNGRQQAYMPMSLVRCPLQILLIPASVGKLTSVNRVCKAQASYVAVSAHAYG